MQQSDFIEYQSEQSRRKIMGGRNVEKKNANWKSKTAPFFTIITPVYNRRSTIQRAMRSVERQTFRDIEYIIIDDGSTEPSDDIVDDFMIHSSLPVMYIKKKRNGGVHTARNIGYQDARGKLLICIDSDDELLPTACESFYNAWMSIPSERRTRYWQIKALCVDQNGNMCSKPFPSDINELPAEEAYKHFSMAAGEQIGCRVVSVLKENLFPEPEGVTFIKENVLWLPLEKRYFSWGSNDVVRIYHTEGNDRLCLTRKRDLQSCVNTLWNSAYAIDHEELFIYSTKQYMMTVIRYCVMEHIIRKHNKDIAERYSITNTRARIMRLFLWFPAMIGAFVYRKKRME